MRKSGEKKMACLCDLAHVEAHGGDHVLVEAARGDHVNEGGLSGMLESHQSQLHLLFPKEGLEPLQQSVDHSKHLGNL